MKKRLFALLLVAALMLCIAPVASFAANSVKKADGTAATNGTDFRTYSSGGQDYWEPITNDLTVSIIASNHKLNIGSVNKITLSNSTFGQIEFTGNNTESTLNLDGSNKVNNALTINASNKTVTLSGTGTLYLTGNSTAAAIASGCTLNYSAFDVLGSTESNASIDSLNSNVELSDNTFKIGNTICKTVYFTPKTAKTIANILPNDFPTTKQTGWANDTGSTLFVSGNDLKFGGVTLNNAVNKPVIKIENNYVYYSNQFKITFVMNSNQLVKIITAGSEHANYNGEFIAQHIHGTGTDAIAFATPWDGGAGHNSMPTESGSYYLTKNITLSGSWTVSNSINLCLNGFNIVREGGNCITINNGGTLSIYDCSDNAHHFDVDSTGLWKLNEDSGSKSLTGGCIMGINPVAGQIDGIGIFINGGGTVNMYGGNIVGCKATSDGGGVMVCKNATFNMNGGSITGNTAGKFGGGIKCDGTLNLNGGSISNNTASLGGGLDVSGTLNMTNGSIDNNTATDLGGGVNANGTFNMYGGEITNNKATNHSGGVCFNNTAATLGGTAKITNNFVGDTPNNFKLMNGKKVDIGTGDNAPKSGMSIGITMETPPGQFTTTSATSGDEQYFTSDNNKYKVEYNTSGYLELKATTIADVLATNTDFPTINNTDIPDDAWVNDNGATAHLAKYQNGSSSFVILYQNKGRSINPDVAVTYSNDSYVYTDAGGFIVTFNMENDVLKSITVSNYNENINGTYKPVTYYTVTFDTDGGSKVDAQEIADGKLVTEPTRPTKDGYAFVAWVDANGKTFDFNTPITSDVTIKATWEKNPAPTPDPEPISYRITEGANSIWVIAAGERPVFRSNADFSKLSHVLLDGQKLHSSAYKGQSGSTIITLTPEFTATLSVGKHTIEIVSTDGSASTVFYIEETIANTDGEGFALSTAAMSSAFIGCNIVGLAVVFFELKKKKVK